MSIDYKDWLQNRANEIANEKYEGEFYELSDNIQTIIWKQAEEDYADYLADMIDNERERRILRE